MNRSAGSDQCESASTMYGAIALFDIDVNINNGHSIPQWLGFDYSPRP
ncbi:hypothetical protein FAGKG844_280038 [Frankia sp. AgKG'84/4]